MSLSMLDAAVPNGSLGLWWLGQAGFAFKTPAGRIVYVDPYLSDAVERLHGFKRLSLSPIDGDARAQFQLAGGVQGVVVTDVIPDSPAAERNFRAGDVIVSVQSVAVRTPDDVARRIDADARAGKKVEILLVNRSGVLTFVALRLG